MKNISADIKLALSRKVHVRYGTGNTNITNLIRMKLRLPFDNHLAPLSDILYIVS